jgi:transposase
MIEGRLSLAIKIRIVLLNAKLGSPSSIRAALAKEGFSDNPSNKAIRRICLKFSETGSVAHAKGAGRPEKFKETEKSQISAILPTSQNLH